MSKTSSRRNSVLAKASRGTAYTAAAGASLVAGASNADGAIHYYYGDLAVPQGTAQPLDINFENDDFDDIVLMNYV